MTSVFWDTKGILLVNCLEKGRKIAGEYYSNLLDQLDGKTNKKMPDLKKKKIIFHQEIAPARRSANQWENCGI